MATASIEIPHLLKGMLVKDWKKSFLAATALLTKEQQLSLLPLYVSRSNGDQQWAYEAAKQENIEDALKELQKRLDGETSLLITSQHFFELSLSESDKSNRASISSFWIKILELGEEAGISKDLMICKFLQNVEHGKKVFDSFKTTIIPTMSNQAMTAVYEEVQKRILNKSDKTQIKKEDVFVVAEDKEHMTNMISNMQEQIDNLKWNIQSLQESEATNMQSEESSNSDDEDDQVLFHKKTNKQRFFCSICRKTNHTSKFCNKRRCENCQGLGHDIDKCPSSKKKQFSKNNQTFKSG